MGDIKNMDKGINFGYIYKIINLINGRIYIGQKKGAFDINYLGSGKIIKQAIKKYGKNNFKIEFLASTIDRKQSNELEIYYIYTYRRIYGNDKLYNIAEGGYCFNNTGRTHFKKGGIPWNKGIKTGLVPKSAFKKGMKSTYPMLGKKHSTATRLKMKLAHLGHNCSVETKRKIGLATSNRLGYWNGKKFSEEHKKRISQSHRRNYE